MKTILVATDFSQAADNACLFAYNLAKSINAKLIIYSAYKELPIILPQVPPISTPENMEEFVEELLKQEVKQLDTHPSITIDIICSKDSSVEGIIEVTERTCPDLLIVGMKEHISALKKVFGSTVKALIGKTTVPLLVIPENKKYNCI